MVLVRRGRPAMATTFEVWLGGDDEEHLDAVAWAALDEVARVERLLSRFDPAAEVARVNREAFARPARVDRELLAILLDCRAWYGRTDGFFDILWVAGIGSSLDATHQILAPTSRRLGLDPAYMDGPPGCGDFMGSVLPRVGYDLRGKLELNPATQRFDDRLMIDEGAGTVRLLDPSARIDLGGYGKGYALDAALRVVDGFGVASAFLHGGTSSALARGLDPSGRPWRVGIRDPFAEEHDAELARVDLVDHGFSSSASFGPGMVRSDIIDPTLGAPRVEQAAVSVIAATAAEAEVFSTALLAMGRTGMGEWLEGGNKGTGPDAPRVAWIDAGGIEWLGSSRR